MQGRLTEKGGFYPQEFPKKWRQEFYSAKSLGFDCIEWMFNEKQWNDNPIILENELKNIVNISQETNVQISGICVNYFMEKSIYEMEDLEYNCFLLNRLLHNAHIIGCKNVIIPLFDASEMQLDNALIYQIINMLVENEVFILFESNEQLSKLEKWLLGFKRSNIGICYDIGNATGLGYNPAKELAEYGYIVKNVHLKDKQCGGNTVMLGNGDACFKECFDALQKSLYTGCYILESYYFKAIEDTYKNLNYVKGIIEC